MVNEIFPGIYTLSIPLPHNPLKALNAYLIKGKERHLLVDTGFNQPECRQALTRGLQQLDVPAQQLDIFITHLHADHCGLVSDFPASETRTVWASEQDALIINQMATEPEHWDATINSLRQHGCDENTLTQLHTDHPAKKYAPTQKVDFTIAQEGDILQYGIYDLHVLEVPGHTPGHLALHIPEKKILIGGDLILGKITPNIACWPMMDDALASYFDSLDKISRLDVVYTLPSHRQLIDDTRTRIAELKKHYFDRLDEIRTLLTAPMCAAEVASQMQWNIKYNTWDDVAPAQRWFAINEALSHLEHLVRKSLVAKQERDGMVYFYPLTQA